MRKAKDSTRGKNLRKWHIEKAQKKNLFFIRKKNNHTLPTRKKNKKRNTKSQRNNRSNKAMGQKRNKFKCHC